MTLRLVAESGGPTVNLYLQEKPGYESTWLTAYGAHGNVLFASADVTVARVEAGEPGTGCRIIAVGVGETQVVAQQGDVQGTIAVRVRETLEDDGFNWF